ncbi:TPA: hypothetical protein MXV65_002435 [Pseudomonas aeruginosa]|nr:MULTISPECIES: hypothetical protein [Pseudomonas]MBH9519084.1 hypothetical protein [Pseudomonas aeruginosa]MBI8577241.1 hypothetical protein [Pseudomonas aeruginosa]MBI8804384.1 hypothetical protein [Pseudomonas aeruginosa]MCU9208637.1 hypothetical protein [Pseudomonas aeruginosa]MDA3374356.1 hypothetical protein [Pseudomonas aeruginosa]
MMKHTVTQPTEAVADIICAVCSQNTRVEGYGLQYGTLQACWGYGARHDGERYEVHLCEACFFGVLSYLRQERRINQLFDEQIACGEEEFGLVRRDDYFRDS